MTQITRENFPNGSAFLSPSGRIVQIVRWVEALKAHIRVYADKESAGQETILTLPSEGPVREAQPVNLDGESLPAPEVFSTEPKKVKGVARPGGPRGPRAPKEPLPEGAPKWLGSASRARLFLALKEAGAKMASVFSTKEADEYLQPETDFERRLAIQDQVRARARVLSQKVNEKRKALIKRAKEAGLDKVPGEERLSASDLVARAREAGLDKTEGEEESPAVEEAAAADERPSKKKKK